LGWKKLFFSSTIHKIKNKKKITQQIINLQKQRFLHPIPILDETNSYPKKKNKDHAWFVLLPFFSHCFIF
jgi:hypothetical protein